MASEETFTLRPPHPKLDTADSILPHLSALKSSSTTTTLNLSGNTLGAPACAALASILRTKTSLQVAIFADIFTSRLLAEIPPALSSLLTACLPLPHLHTIDLSDNAFGLNTAAPLVAFLSQHVPLRHLILNNNGLGPEAGALVADALTTLAGKKEEARRKDGGAQVPALETVVCGRNRLESGSMGAWARCFRANQGVKVVRMVQNGIRQEGIATLLKEGLGRCEGVEVLDLQDNTFTVVGARALAGVVGGWPGLRELGVGDCLVGARGMVHLVREGLGKGGNGGLRVLRAQYNEIELEGVKALVEAVKGGSLEGLRRVELNGNKFSEDDEAVERLRTALEERKEESKEGGEGEWGLDELSDLEEMSEDEDEDEDEREDDEEEEEEKEGKADKVLEEADQEENSKVSQKKDEEVDELAEQLGKTVLK